MNATRSEHGGRLSRRHAESLDASDDLASMRQEFAIPRAPNGRQAVYLCGNSLGLMPRGVPEVLQREANDWARLGVEGHFKATTPWFSYHEVFRDAGARLVGAKPGEVVMMNSLTVNLHLMMASFYRPTSSRFKIVIEDHAFPSDRYAVASQARWHGYDPRTAVVVARPSEGDTLTPEDFSRLFATDGDSVALVLLGGVNFVSGQLFDLQAMATIARAAGCIVGLDLAHAAGNVPLALHDWNVDFAAWCSYKYLNAGPGAVAGCFVHERYGANASIPRLAGWWGNDPETRFRMSDEFMPRAGADGWQVSNPSIFAMAPLRVSIEQFDRVGMTRLRNKSVRLTGYLEHLLNVLQPHGVHIVTPRDASARGCQLSIRIPGNAADLVNEFSRQGIVVDSRPPDILRVAPVPMYNSFADVWDFASHLAEVVGGTLGRRDATDE